MLMLQKDTAPMKPHAGESITIAGHLLHQLKQTWACFVPPFFMMIPLGVRLFNHQQSMARGPLYSRVMEGITGYLVPEH